jgi:hypothetical protein
VRPQHWLLRAFPRAWRDRYGDEVADLLSDIESDETKLRTSDLLDLVRAGASQRCVEVWRRMTHPRRQLAARMAIGGVGLAALALVALISTGSIFGPTTSSPTTHMVARSQPHPSGHEIVTTQQQTAARQAATQAVAQQAVAQAVAQAAAQQAGNGGAAQTAATQQAVAAQQAAAQAAAEQAAESAAAPAG